MTGTEPHRPFTSAQQASLEISTADRDRTLDAIHQLEAAVAAPAPRNESAWLLQVREALGDLDIATRDEADNAARPDSLLSDIKRTQPILASRVRGVRAQYLQARESITSLLGDIERHNEGEGVDYADIRQRVAWTLTALRHQRARESDLIYEAYYAAFRSDLDVDAPN